MNWLRNSLIGAILVVSYLLFLRWNTFQETQFTDNITAETTISTPVDNTNTQANVDQLNSTSDPQLPTAASESDIPEFSEIDQEPTNNAAVDETVNQSRLIEVKTDVLQVTIDTLGGDIAKVALPKFFAKLNTPEKPFILLNHSESRTYIAQSGLIGPNGTDKRGASRPIFKSSKSSYQMTENNEVLVVDLHLQQDQAKIIKRFTFNKGSYLINIDYVVTNNSDQPWAANIYGQIKRDDYKPKSESGFGMKPYLGAAITTTETNYKKIDFEDLADEPFEVTEKGGWVSMVQHYFISAWIPDPELTNSYNLRKVKGKDIYLLGFSSERKTIPPKQTDTIKSSFYAGPKNLETLIEVSEHLALTLDFGWLWFIGKPLFIALEYIHGIVGNWGVSIILLTCFIKLIFFYPSAMSFRSMAKMRKLQPAMQDLKERYSDDRQRMSKELMDLYKKQKVNPLGGCLPVLMQMPVFIALYWVLMESVELRHAPFFLWIHDLSIKDPYFVLPLIMGVTMFIQQKLTPMPADPMQAKVMQIMPIFFTAFMAFFPAGLVLYWVVNNTLSISQQYVITRQIEKS